MTPPNIFIFYVMKNIILDFESVLRVISVGYHPKNWIINLYALPVLFIYGILFCQTKINEMKHNSTNNNHHPWIFRTKKHAWLYMPLQNCYIDVIYDGKEA